jgi:hypothetical protein
MHDISKIEILYVFKGVAIEAKGNAEDHFSVDATFNVA